MVACVADALNLLYRDWLYLRIRGPGCHTGYFYGGYDQCTSEVALSLKTPVLQARFQTIQTLQTIPKPRIHIFSGFRNQNTVCYESAQSMTSGKEKQPTKTFENLETEASGTEISRISLYTDVRKHRRARKKNKELFSRISFQKFQKLLNFSTENSRNSGSKVEWKENFRVGLGFPPFWKFWKMLFHSLLEVAENSYQTFWLNEKWPLISAICESMR